MVYKEIDFNYCSFWIQFHDLPLEGIEVENAITLESTIGEVLMVENPRYGDLLARSFLRARAMVDLRNQLVTGIWTSRPDGDPVWIKARYKRLQNYCYLCGKIGHGQRSCPELGAKEVLKFGSWLSVQGARKSDVEMIYCGELWEEFEKKVLPEEDSEGKIYEHRESEQLLLKKMEVVKEGMANKKDRSDGEKVYRRYMMKKREEGKENNCKF